MAFNQINRVRQAFLQLNLFKKPSSTEQTLFGEQIATRIYICALAVSLISITIITALMIRTIEKTESKPTYIRFLQLASRHPDTLNCPCSKYAISYQTFVSTRVQFHQVCSSQFVEQLWFDMIFTNEYISIESADDFRVTLSFFWQTIAGLCNASRNAWNDAVSSFNSSRLLSRSTFNEETVRIQVETTFKNLIRISQTTMTRNLLAIRRTTSGNKIVSGLQTNFYFYLRSSGSIQAAPRIFNDDCSCLNIEGCPRPATFNDSDGNLITIPGMITDCLVVDATLASTLECYYNQTCVALLHPSLPRNIQPLSNNSFKHSSSNSTIQTLLNELMIEERISNVHFNLYYSECNPQYCSYSYTRRWHMSFIFTTIIGIFGGLSFGIRLLAPFVAKIVLRRRNRVLPTTNVSQTSTSRPHQFHIIWAHIRGLPQQIRQKLVSLNIFETSTPRTLNNIHQERLYTRIFIILLIISSISTGLYLFFDEQNHLITISHPSLATYEQLYNDRSTKLQCPCSQISIPYKEFLNVTFILHQVCSSDLVSSEWLKYLTLLNPTVLPDTELGLDDTRDFRTIGASYFQILSTFCSMVEANIADAQRVFGDTQFINDRVLSRSIFLQKTQTIIDSFINTTCNNFASTVDWIDIAFKTSLFWNGANVIFDIRATTDNQLNITFPTYTLYSTFSETELIAFGTCSCVIIDEGCYLLPLLYSNASYLDQFPSTLFIEVIKIGCTPVLGFQISKIQWWYDAIYFEQIRQTYSFVINSQSSPNIKPLNTSIFSRFGDVTADDLIREMFLETAIGNNTSFDKFYTECAPVSCTYSNIQRRNLFASFLLLIAVCNGLNKILRLLIPLFGKLFLSCIDLWKGGHRRHAISTCDCVKHLLIRTYQSIKGLNLFTIEPTDNRSIHQQLVYTRIYLVIYLTSLSILLFYTAIVERSITKTYSVSSIMDYKQLLTDLQTDDVNCPCTRISIPYGDFVSELRVNRFHEACETNTIDKILSSGLPAAAIPVFTNGRNFELWQQFFIESIKLLCSLAVDIVDNSIRIFLTSTMLTNQLQSLTEFINEVNYTIDQFQQRTPIIFAQTLDLIRLNAQGNTLSAAFSSNWDLMKAGEDIESNNSFITIPIIHHDIEQNTSCSCSTLRTCKIPAEITKLANLTLIVEGLVFGCHLLETVLLSTLSCFYSPTCIHNVREALGAVSAGFNTSTHLHNSSTRFNVNDTIETMAYQMFIESWTNTTSYERFYNSCSPNYCTYIYRYRFDALEMLTTFLGVFPGLSSAIRFTVPYLVRIFQKI
ncbi:unnamed protein product [Adineta ricciae]|uniref:Uncharacterized protein n=1 Tax=Adineta ricciae TaxID=249248 RepID=A0A815WET6_ADIRI|nr:unnamed protein product [Adineta ricciae]